MNIGVTSNALLVAERLFDGLPQRDADVFSGVVVVDVEIAPCRNTHVDARVARQKIQHVVEKTDAGRDGGLAGAVEIDGDVDIGLLRGSPQRGLAHGSPFRQAAPFYQANKPGATAAPQYR